MAVSISVIIPTWNRADSLVAAVESVLRQTYPVTEILVCDDGSSDDSEARIAALDDARIKWVSGPRGGCPAIPRNRGLALAKGEWIAFLDSDDVWLPEKIAHQVRGVLNSENLASCTDAWRFCPGKPAMLMLGGKNGAIAFEDLMQDNRVICSSVLAHRSLFDQVEGFPVAKGLIEDYALWLRMLALTDFDYISLPLLNYRDDPSNSVRANDSGRWAQRTPIMKDLIAWARRVRPARKRYVIRAARYELYISYAYRAASFLLRMARKRGFFVKAEAA